MSEAGGPSSAAVREWRRQHRPGSPGKIDRDPEVRAFFEANIPDMTFAELAAAALSRFGRERAPSPSSVQRWWRRNKQRLLSN